MASRIFSLLHSFTSSLTIVTTTPEPTPTLIYPRRTLIRRTMRVVGGAMMHLLARVSINHMGRFPRSGRLIVVGNHNAALEAAMMVVLSPRIVELIATGEIPLDPRYARLIHTYGIIPIQRGQMDRVALNSALDVLKQEGVVGIFPEGGIWESQIKKGRTGVAWLSYMSGAPVLPIGFGGIDGALAAAFKFKRPRLTMNVGELIPAVKIDEARAKKEALQDATDHIMDAIAALIPQEDKDRWNHVRDERFELRLHATGSDGSLLELPPDLRPAQPAMLAKFFHRPLMLDVFVRNLELPAQALQRLDTERDPRALAEATGVVLGYLEKNPHFLSYRFGYEEAAGMHDGLTKLRDLGRWLAERGGALHIVPVRRYKRQDSDAEIVEERVGGVPAL
jgi:1-acyl-sn-glycerol-3-phosphate acyltransferase